MHVYVDWEVEGQKKKLLKKGRDRFELILVRIRLQETNSFFRLFLLKYVLLFVLSDKFIRYQ